jgi:hypothetical protein
LFSLIETSPVRAERAATPYRTSLSAADTIARAGMTFDVRMERFGFTPNVLRGQHTDCILRYNDCQFLGTEPDSANDGLNVCGENAGGR